MIGIQGGDSAIAWDNSNDRPDRIAGGGSQLEEIDHGTTINAGHGGLSRQVDHAR